MEVTLKRKYRDVANGRFKAQSRTGAKGATAGKAARRRQRYKFGSYRNVRIQTRESGRR